MIQMFVILTLHSAYFVIKGIYRFKVQTHRITFNVNGVIPISASSKEWGVLFIIIGTILFILNLIVFIQE